MSHLPSPEKQACRHTVEPHSSAANSQRQMLVSNHAGEESSGALPKYFPDRPHRLQSPRQVAQRWSLEVPAASAPEAKTPPPERFRKVSHRLDRPPAFYRLKDVVRFIASCTVIPHLKIKPLQFHGVLLRVEEGARYSLLPDFASYFLQVFQVSS